MKKYAVNTKVKPGLSERDLYLNLMKRSLLGLTYLDKALIRYAEEVVTNPDDFSILHRMLGLEIPSRAFSMIGWARMDNIQYCIDTVLADNVPGDFIETGVWRGGATIFMKACLVAHGDTERKIWLADSFEGLPKANIEKYPEDKNWVSVDMSGTLAVSLQDVANNFARYGLGDENVLFIPGWFKDTLPNAPVGRLAILRLDGDMYESTMDALVNLYPKLSPGGFCIVDDYNLWTCEKAVTDYRAEHKITEEIVDIDGSGAYWRVK